MPPESEHQEGAHVRRLAYWMYFWGFVMRKDNLLFLCSLSGGETNRWDAIDLIAWQTSLFLLGRYSMYGVSVEINGELGVLSGDRACLMWVGSIIFCYWCRISFHRSVADRSTHRQLCFWYVWSYIEFNKVDRRWNQIKFYSWVLEDVWDTLTAEVGKLD